MTATTAPLPKVAGRYGLSRRVQRDHQHEAERQIGDVMQAVEVLGADPLLTDAVIHLQKARDLVSNWLEGGQKALP